MFEYSLRIVAEWLSSFPHVQHHLQCLLGVRIIALSEGDMCSVLWCPQRKKANVKQASNLWYISHHVWCYRGSFIYYISVIIFFYTDMKIEDEGHFKISLLFLSFMRIWTRKASWWSGMTIAYSLGFLSVLHWLNIIFDPSFFLIPHVCMWLDFSSKCLLAR